MSDLIKVIGISAKGFHGVFASERKLGQKFVVDVELTSSLKNLNDDLTSDFVCAKSCYGYENVGKYLKFSAIRSECCLIDKNFLGNIISIEASEHIMPWHGGFFMRNWRRKEKFSRALCWRNAAMI